MLLDDFSKLPPEGGKMVGQRKAPVAQAEAEDEGVTVFVKVDYKVLLALMVVLDIFHFSLNEVIARGLD